MRMLVIPGVLVRMVVARPVRMRVGVRVVGVLVIVVVIRVPVRMGVLYSVRVLVRVAVLVFAHRFLPARSLRQPSISRATVPAPPPLDSGAELRYIGLT
jgi:hypothetical protein